MTYLDIGHDVNVVRRVPLPHPNGGRIAAAALAHFEAAAFVLVHVRTGIGARIGKMESNLGHAARRVRIRLHQVHVVAQFGQSRQLRLQVLTRIAD